MYPKPKLGILQVRHAFERKLEIPEETNIKPELRMELGTLSLYTKVSISGITITSMRFLDALLSETL